MTRLRQILRFQPNEYFFYLCQGLHTCPLLSPQTICYQVTLRILLAEAQILFQVGFVMDKRTFERISL
jgi:hypothetical protein